MGGHSKQVNPGERWVNLSRCGLSRYEVSNLGVVRNRKTKHVMKPYDKSKEADVRLKVTLVLDEPRMSEAGNFIKSAHFYISRLVLLGFVGDPPNETDTADHINKIKDDNRLCNLRWLSKRQQNRAENKTRRPKWNPIYELKKSANKDKIFARWDYKEDIAEKLSVSVEEVEKAINEGTSLKGHRYVYIIDYFSPSIPDFYWKRLKPRGYLPIRVCPYLGAIERHSGEISFGTDNNDGYLYHTLTYTGDSIGISINCKVFNKRKENTGTPSVHRLIMIAIWGNQPDMVVDHLSGETKDNRIYNLEYVTQAENSRRAKMRAKKN